MQKEQHDKLVQLRMSSRMFEAIDDWRRKQDDLPSRSEAIRRLVEIAMVKGNPAKSGEPE